MILANLLDTLRENSYIFLAILVGAVVGHLVGRLITQRRLDASQIRKKLGSSIDKYSAIPAARLNSALERAAWIDRPFLRFSISVCGTAVWIMSAFVSTEIFGRIFPDSPGWSKPLIAGGVAGALTFVSIRIERVILLQRLKHLDIKPDAKQAVPTNGP
jgi:hypothetical protein